ncbi:MAG: segregation and condensation protein A [Anaerocolumna sp.]
MSISYKLEAFEGPLDLLLHLIDKNKVNIYDIPIVEITEQYLAYVKEMDTINLDLMSEFLVMAATLIRIKSQMLLPKDKTKPEDIDPRQELVDRLLEYKMFKYISQELKDKEQDADRILYRNQNIPREIEDFKEEVNINELLDGLTLAKLHHIFQSVMKRQVDKIDPIRSKFGNIEKEEINLNEKMDSILAYAISNRCFSFSLLLLHQPGKVEVIVSFLAVLELMKIGEITIKQDELFDDISITYIGKEEAIMV